MPTDTPVKQNNVTIHCLYDKLLPIDELIAHPKNPNAHPEEQIDRLGLILKRQGFRYAIKVSTRSNFIVSGHGRRLAAQAIGMTHVPVVYQDYESEELEYADVVADNAIALWAELDYSRINDNLKDLGPDMDIDLLGIRDFTLDWHDKDYAERVFKEIIDTNNEDLMPHRTIYVHFESEENVQGFAQLVGQFITKDTKSIWFPMHERNNYSDKSIEIDVESS